MLRTFVLSAFLSKVVSIEKLLYFLDTFLGILILLSRSDCIFYSPLSKFFEKVRDNLCYSYFKDYLFDRSDEKDCSQRFDFTVSIWISDLWTNSVLENK